MLRIRFAPKGLIDWQSCCDKFEYQDALYTCLVQYILLYTFQKQTYNEFSIALTCSFPIPVEHTWFIKATFDTVDSVPWPCATIDTNVDFKIRVNLISICKICSRKRRVLLNGAPTHTNPHPPLDLHAYPHPPTSHVTHPRPISLTHQVLPTFVQLCSYLPKLVQTHPHPPLDLTHTNLIAM